MANITDRKTNLYAEKQSVKEASFAPLHLDSAGDLLIQELYEKQSQKKTTIEEQLSTVQNFEKGEQFLPLHKSGVSTLTEFKESVCEKTSYETLGDSILKGEDLWKQGYRSRHELELELAIKPDSASTRLYEFSLQKKMCKKYDKYPIGHPMHKLAEIEKEYFSGPKPCAGENKMCVKPKKKRIRKNRKRKKTAVETGLAEPKYRQSVSEEVEVKETQSAVTSPECERTELMKPVSLWDVRNMDSFCNNKTYTCENKNIYTVKDGKIVKLNDDKRLLTTC